MGTDAYKQLLWTHMKAENAHQMEETLATLAEDCLFEDQALGHVFQGYAGAKDLTHLDMMSLGILSKAGLVLPNIYDGKQGFAKYV
jgi:hypothetical protein